MAELYLDIRLNLDEGDKKRLKDELNEINKLKDAARGDTKSTQRSTSAIQAQAKAQKELNDKFRRLVNLNEVRFRQGKVSAEQATRYSNLLEEAAINQGVLTDNTKRGVASQKALFLSQQRISTGFTGISQESRRANQSLLNLGRIVQDLPFGFLGISNNIDPALNSFKELKNDAGGVKGAFSQLLLALKGPGGLIFALGSLLPTVVLMSKNGMNFFAKSSKDASNAIDELADSTRDFIGESSRLRISESGFLNIFDIQGKIESTQRLISVFSDELANLKQQAQAAASQSAAFGLATGSNVKALNDAESALKSIKDQFKLTDDDIKNINKTLEDFQAELRQARALASLDPLAQYRDGLNKATNEFIELAKAGAINRRQLSDVARGYVEAQNDLRPLIATNEDARQKYFLLEESIESLLSAYKSLAPEQQKAVQVTDEEAKKTDLLAKMEARYQEQLKKRMAVLKLIASKPQEQFTEEGGELDAFRAKQQIRNQIELQGLQNLALKKATIRQEFQSKREELLRQGINIYKETLMIEGEQMTIAQALQLQQHREFENAKTEITQSEAEKRREVIEKLVQLGFSLTANYLSSLQQLNQAQTDRTEAQARQKFETQKKLARAQAIVASGAAIARQYADLPLYAAIPASIATALATRKQIQAINATQFNSGASPSGGDGSSEQGAQERGFFITDVNESPIGPSRPSEERQFINIEVENVLDREGLALRVKEGNEQLSSRNFTVISNG